MVWDSRRKESDVVGGQADSVMRVADEGGIATANEGMLAKKLFIVQGGRVRNCENALKRREKRTEKKTFL